MLIWWDMTQSDTIQFDVMSASWFSFELNILTLPVIASRMLIQTGDGKWRGEQTGGSISWCPALIRLCLFSTPAKIPLLLFSNHLVCASNHLLLRHLGFDYSCSHQMEDVENGNLVILEVNIDVSLEPKHHREVIKGLFEFWWRFQQDTF